MTAPEALAGLKDGQALRVSTNGTPAARFRASLHSLYRTSAFRAPRATVRTHVVDPHTVEVWLDRWTPQP